ncbi:antitoxin Xre/MbcA/ParS toxin-binding domain-containing protein [Marinobacter sp. M5B]|uniref:type II RES/Xre toxin-antitoxin system antitoxin n=1 Tax=Marinobacter sp. M5B TaxID=3141535 RepID=UPI0036D27872
MVALNKGKKLSLNADLIFQELISSTGTELKVSFTPEAIRSGEVPTGVVPGLADWLNIDCKDMLKLLKISRSTFYRRKRSGVLRGDEADRVYRYVRLYTLASTLFHGDIDSAREWLNRPAYAFRSKTPLEHATTEIGAHEVETLIGRIEHGIPS